MSNEQIRFWFVMDEIKARLHELERQRSRGAEISPEHMDAIDRIAAEFRVMANAYDTVSPHTLEAIRARAEAKSEARAEHQLSGIRVRGDQVRSGRLGAPVGNRIEQ